MKRRNHSKADLLIPQTVQLSGGIEPDYTPMRLLKLGVFGGNYFADATVKDLRGMNEPIVTLAKQNMQPFSRLNNCFGVQAGLPYADWHRNGWIFDEDPLGWFHWYCRYYSGRRHARDRHQISRWVKYKQRWGDRAQSQLQTTGRISSVIMQGLLQWGIDPFLGEA